MKKLLLVSVLSLVAICGYAKEIKITIENSGSKPIIMGSNLHVTCTTISVSMAGYSIAAQDKMVVGSFNDTGVAYPATVVLSGVVNTCSGETCYAFDICDKIILSGCEAFIHIKINTDTKKVVSVIVTDK